MNGICETPVECSKSFDNNNSNKCISVCALDINREQTQPCHETNIYFLLIHHHSVSPHALHKHILSSIQSFDIYSILFFIIISNISFLPFARQLCLRLRLLLFSFSDSILMHEWWLCRVVCRLLMVYNKYVISIYFIIKSIDHFSLHIVASSCVVVAFHPPAFPSYIGGKTEKYLLLKRSLCH